MSTPRPSSPSLMTSSSSAAAATLSGEDDAGSETPEYGSSTPERSEKEPEPHPLPLDLEHAYQHFAARTLSAISEEFAACVTGWAGPDVFYQDMHEVYRRRSRHAPGVLCDQCSCHEKCEQMPALTLEQMREMQPRADDPDGIFTKYLMTHMDEGRRILEVLLGFDNFDTNGYDRRLQWLVDACPPPVEACPPPQRSRRGARKRKSAAPTKRPSVTRASTRAPYDHNTGGRCAPCAAPELAGAGTSASGTGASSMRRQKRRSESPSPARCRNVGPLPGSDDQHSHGSTLGPTWFPSARADADDDAMQTAIPIGPIQVEAIDACDDDQSAQTETSETRRDEEVSPLHERDGREHAAGARWGASDRNHGVGVHSLPRGPDDAPRRPGCEGDGANLSDHEDATQSPCLSIQGHHRGAERREGESFGEEDAVDESKHVDRPADDPDPGDDGDGELGMHGRARPNYDDGRPKCDSDDEVELVD